MAKSILGSNRLNLLISLGGLIFAFILLYIRVESQHQAAFPTVNYHEEARSIALRGGGVQASPLSLTIWSSDFHISPIADIKQIVKSWGVKVIDKSLSGHCHLTRTCARDLKVINAQNGITLPCPNQLRRAFYDAYRNDPEFLSADAYLCTHADSMCELFLPFGKPLIVVASTRYEIGRLEASHWHRWNHNLQKIAQQPHNAVGTNNLYDRRYMQYFTNLTEAQMYLLPNLCQYVTARYVFPSPRQEILLAPYRGIHSTLQRNLLTALNEHRLRTGSKLEIQAIADVYPAHYEYSQLASHPAIVLLPYQVSIMSFFEYYRMQIPIFVPSARLLATWHLEHRLLKERTWMSVFDMPQYESTIPRHHNSSCPLRTDPNNEFDRTAVEEWVALSDFYTWPHVQTFDTFERLFTQLQSTDLREISHRMRAHNALVQHQVEGRWHHILERVQRYKEAHAQQNLEPLPEDINDALARFYQVRLQDGSCDVQVDVA